VPVSADLTACFLPTNPRKNAASRRENANSGERQTLCWREVDSDHRFLQARDAFDAFAPVRAPMDAPLGTGENEVVVGDVGFPVYLLCVHISTRRVGQF
jgi:hypothetical protein